jgi:ribosomal protein L3 glutamine methyltransferase
MAEQSRHELDALITVRDWLRWAVSRFEAAGLTYGHGTGNALDEACFLILKTLHLPIDQLEPWLDARLTRPERVSLLAIIEQRVETRKPAAYLVNEAWSGGHPFWVDERVIVPRSYIGELLGMGLTTVVAEPRSVRKVLDLCTGSGYLAVLAALVFPETSVDASDISADALAVAARNVASYGLADRVTLLEGDLFAPVTGRIYDLIVANPPYVSAEALAAFPSEHRAEPMLAHAGGEDGLAVVRRILTQAAAHLAPHGNLVVEVGAGRALLEAEYSDVPFVWLDTEESEGELFWLRAADLPTQAARGRPSAALG